MWMHSRALSPLFAAAFVLLLGGCATVRPPSNATAVKQTMTVTAYDPGKESCGWKRKWCGLGPAVYAYGPNKGKPKKVGITASGTKAREPKGSQPGTIAADTTRYPFGTLMYVPGYGYGRVEDRGGAIKGDHIDVFFKKRRVALEWGRQTQPVVVWLPRERQARR